MEVVEIRIPLFVELLLLSIRLPVPITPPETINNWIPLLFVRVVPELFTVIAVVLILS